MALLVCITLFCCSGKKGSTNKYSVYIFLLQIRYYSLTGYRTDDVPVFQRSGQPKRTTVHELFAKCQEK